MSSSLVYSLLQTSTPSLLLVVRIRACSSCSRTAALGGRALAVEVEVGSVVREGIALLMIGFQSKPSGTTTLSRPAGWGAIGMKPNGDFVPVGAARAAYGRRGSRTAGEW